MKNIPDNQLTLKFMLKSPIKNVFEGDVHTLTSINLRGIFDILPLHTNFITLISDYVIVDKGLPSEKRFNMKKGILYVLSNKVSVYEGI